MRRVIIQLLRYGGAVAARAEGALRADARRNREQIVAAASALFAERGPDVRMEEIAQRAGVGVGTLYRRFPDREALVRAVAFGGFHRVLVNARAAADDRDAWAGLSRLLRHSVVEMRLVTLLSMWFACTWAAIAVDPERRQLRAELLEILGRLVRRAQEDGAMRTDVGTGDVAMLLSLVLRPFPGPLGAVTERNAERYVVLLLDGLRACPAGPLPGRAVTVEDLDRHE